MPRPALSPEICAIRKEKKYQASKEFYMTIKFTKLNRLYSYLLSSVLLCILLGVLLGDVGFGNGLGDIGHILVLFATTLLSWVALVVNRERRRELMITNVILSIPFLWLILSVKLL